MENRKQFIDDVMRETATVTELCGRYGISRKTAYKWIDRYRREGPAGLEDRPRRPRVSPHATDPGIVTEIIEARRRHPTWGADRLLTLLQKRDPDIRLPSRSTVCDILSRHGLIGEEVEQLSMRSRQKVANPNDLWHASFGHYCRLGDGSYSYALTVSDDLTCYLLACEAVSSLEVEHVMPLFEHLFRDFGLPTRISAPAATPFGSRGLGRLSLLSAWWSRAGVVPELFDPFGGTGRQQEEMLDELRGQMLNEPAENLAQQQRRLDRFRMTFNREWLPQPTYQPSSRKLPRPLPSMVYPPHFETRRVSANGGIRWKSNWIGLSAIYAGEDVGLEEFDNGLWDVWFGVVIIGRLDERLMKIVDIRTSG